MPDLATPVEPPAAPSSPATFDETWRQFVTVNDQQWKRRLGMLLGFAAFGLLALHSLDVASAAILVGVLLFHELGHVAAMRVFGFRDLGVFFLPFLGAVATGRKRDATAWQRGVVLLAGPLPGLVLGWSLILFAPALGLSDRHVMTAAGMLLAINAYNLLPLVPLDGGRLMNLVLFGRYPFLDTAFAVLTGLALAVLSAVLQLWLLVAAAVFMAFTAFAQRRLMKAAHKLRADLAGGPTEAADLAPEARQRLYESASGALTALEGDSGRTIPADRRPKVLASYMHTIFDRAVAPRATVGVSLALVTIYLIACVMLVPLAIGLLAEPPASPDAITDVGRP